MKVAYHFKCNNIKVQYDILFYKIVFANLLELNEPFISSKILSGDLTIYGLIDKYNTPNDFLNYLFGIDTWRRPITSKQQYFLEDNVFIICFETIQKEIAIKLDKSLLSEEHYLGAYEIDDSNQLQWIFYSQNIGTKFRILNKSLNILIESDEIENREYADDMKGYLKEINFDGIQIEFSNYRNSMLDDKHTFENAKRASEWKKSTESLFTTITDEIIAKLTDTAPELTDKLWSANQTFINAQTGEQYAQAMTSCRRIFEYVTDCLFPATDKIIEGHSLKKDKYKNRLLEFAKRELKSEINIDLIVANTSSLFEEWNKLYDLSNKGVHSDPHRHECRRCIIRTILLLDDLIAIKQTPFQVKVIAEKSIKDFYERDEG